MGAHSILEKPLSLKSHHSRKATFLEKPLFSRRWRAQRPRKATFPEKPLFAKSDFSRDVGAQHPRKAAFVEKPLFSKKTTFCEKLLFSRRWSARCPRKAAFPAKEVFSKSNFLRTATFLIGFPANLEDASCDSLVIRAHSLGYTSWHS